MTSRLVLILSLLLSLLTLSPAQAKTVEAFATAPKPAGFAFVLGAKTAYQHPPVPKCDKREMLARKRTVCVKNPQYIPIQVPKETLRWANSNIKVGLPNWREDYTRILSVRPDFITLQEMAGRTDEELAVDGYAIYRSHEHTYTKETPVLWNTARWEVQDTGTRWLTRRKVKWGERAVNWAVLKSKTTGRVITIMSAHPAPTVKRTEGLLPIFMRGLYPLVEDLHERGEVLVGGDFNMHYQSGLYQQAGVAASKLESTFDVFGKLPTGRHYGATIDYMFVRESPHLVPTKQGKWLQNSDHNVIWSEWALSTPVKLLPRQVARARLKHSSRPIPYS